MGRIRVAIDGPAGAGKSTLARLLAELLGYTYIDTGAMYRALTLLVLRNNTDWENEIGIMKLFENHSIEQLGTKTLLDGKDISLNIREKSVSNAVSIVCRHKSVRARMVELQRKAAEKSGIVMDGRDIGTVVLPDAELKIFLVASTEERAQRRKKELDEMGKPMALEAVRDNILDRDKLDSSREIAPLKKADDAVLIDNTNLSIEAEMEVIKKLVREKEREHNGEK